MKSSLGRKWAQSVHNGRSVRTHNNPPFITVLHLSSIKTLQDNKNEPHLKPFLLRATNNCPIKDLWKTLKLAEKHQTAFQIKWNRHDHHHFPNCVLLAAVLFHIMTAAVDQCSISSCEGGLGRTYWVSEFLPWVMIAVNSTSLRASTWNQWLVSSGSAHHAPPYRSSSFSEPCSCTTAVFRTSLSSWLENKFGPQPCHYPNFPNWCWARWKVMFTCMLSRPRWAENPWWDWEEASSWSSSTRWDSRPSGGQSWKNKMSFMTLIYETNCWCHSFTFRFSRHRCLLQPLLFLLLPLLLQPLSFPV